MNRLAVFECYDANNPALQLRHDAPESDSSVRLYFARQWILHNVFAPFPLNVGSGAAGARVRPSLCETGVRWPRNARHFLRRPQTRYPLTSLL